MKILTWILTILISGVCLSGWFLSLHWGVLSAASYSLMLLSVWGFCRWLRSEERKHEEKMEELKDSNKSGDILNADTEFETVETLHPTDSTYPNDPQRYLREQIRNLQSDKADKAVVKSEIRRVQDRIKNATDDVDDLKAQMLVGQPHICIHDGDIGEMKKAIEANKELSQDAQRTASLASDRGFRILMGAVAGFLTFGIAFVVWAVSVSYTADEANRKATQAVKFREMDSPESPPPQIIIASPEYLDSKTSSLQPVQPEPGQAVDIEKALERAFSKALEKREEDLRTDPSLL